MTTYDTTGLGGVNPPWPIPDPEDTSTGPLETAPDTLALLRDRVAQQVEIEPVVIPVADTGVRLVCHTDITSRQMSRWQKLALPAALRKSPKATALDIDQMQLAAAVLVNTLLRIEVADPKHPGEWLPVVDSRTGEPLGFGDKPVLDMFGAIDTITGLKRLFGRESGVVKASRLVTQASGWGDDEMVNADEDADPDPM